MFPFLVGRSGKASAVTVVAVAAAAVSLVLHVHAYAARSSGLPLLLAEVERLLFLCFLPCPSEFVRRLRLNAEISPCQLDHGRLPHAGRELRGSALLALRTPISQSHPARTLL